MRKNTILATLGLALALAPSASPQFTPTATAVPDSVPNGMNYQGRLEKDGFPVSGTKTMAFRLYNAATGGTALYSSGNLAVPVTQGLFSVSLDIPFGALTGTSQKYLELEVESTTLAPRDPLRSVPYAKVAETVEGTIEVSTSGLTFTTNNIDSLAISSSSGRVGIGTASPASRLHISSGAGEAGTIVLVSTGASVLVTIDGNGAVTANSFVGDGTPLRNVVRRSGDSMSGPLTLNASTLTVGGSGFSVNANELFVGGARVGVLTATPQVPLDVVGTAAFGSGGTRSTIAATGALALDTNASLSVGTTFFVNNGRVGVGTVSPSASSKMHIIGDVMVGNPAVHDTSASSDLLVDGNLIVDGKILQHSGLLSNFNQLSVSGELQAGQTFAVGYTSFNVTTAGLVGIGTASPGATLTLVGDQSVSQSATFASSITVRGPNRLLGGYMDPATFHSSLTVRQAAEFGLTGVSSFTSAGGLTLAAGRDVRLTAGGQVVGLPATPTVDDAAASKAYVNSQVLGGFSGWTRDTVNSEVELSNAGDEVGIGTTTPLATLSVGGYSSFALPATFGSSVTIRNAAAFGTTGQSSFNGAGVLTLGTQLAIGSGGTGGTTQATAQSALNVPSTTGSGASGTWGIGISGNAATATQLAANGGNCGAGSFAAGVSDFGVAEGCVDVGTQAELDAHAALTNPHSATDANTASRIVMRDASGNFSAGTITAALTGNVAGNATTATALAVNGGNCAAGSFAAGVSDLGVAEGCVDVGTQAELDAHAALTNPHSATDANTASRIVLRDASGNFSAGTITAAATSVTGAVSAASVALTSGKLTSAGTDPAISACGTTPSFVGSDTAGKVTIGTGATTSCTVTFSAAFGAAPACAVTGSATGPNIAATTTTGVLTITSSADMQSNVVMYVCVGL